MTPRLRGGFLRGASLSLLLWGHTVPGTAQVPTNLREQGCPECSVSVVRAATLSGAELLGEPSAVLRLPDGRFLLSFFASADLIQEFDALGAGQGRFAPKGQGPGEVAWVTHLERLPGDSVMAFDAGNGRATVFPKAGGGGRTFRLPGAVEDAAVAEAGTLLINTSTTAAPTQPLHLIGPDGRIRWSTGAHPQLQLPTREPELALHRVASNGAGRLWSVMATCYEVREWGPGGVVNGWWKRQASHSPCYFVDRVIDPTKAFPGWVVDLEWLDGSLLAVLIHVAGDDWQRYLGAPVRTRGGRTVYPNWKLDKVHATVLEVVDVDHGEILLSERLPGYAVGFADRAHVAFYREDGLGNPFVDVFRLIYTFPN